MWVARAVSRSVVVACAGLTVTLTVLAVPSLHLAYRSPAGHLVLETTVTLVGALVALLLYGRYRRTTALRDLLLVHSLSLLSVTALVFVTLPAVLGARVGETAGSWAALLVRLVGAVLLVASALVAPGRRRPVAHPVREVGALVLALVLIAAAVAALASGLPDVVRVTIGPESSAGPVLSGQPLVYVVQALNLACYALAAVVLTRRAADADDDLLGWIGAASAAGACARLAYLLFPSLYTEWLYVGDLLRLAMYVLLLVGAVREIRRAWQAQASLAVQAERRRLARDLHDGVVQELGVIRAQARHLPDSAAAIAMSAAADRAVDEARRALDALVAHPDDGLARALLRATQDVGDRYGVQVRLSLDDAVDVGPQAREALIRIAREAVVNAAKHARSPVVVVHLSPGRLVVEDRGDGFDPRRGRPGGFGLTSMRERAEGMRATVRIESAVGEGTRVLVSW